MDDDIVKRAQLGTMTDNDNMLALVVLVSYENYLKDQIARVRTFLDQVPKTSVLNASYAVKGAVASEEGIAIANGLLDVWIQPITTPQTEGTNNGRHDTHTNNPS